MTRPAPPIQVPLPSSPAPTGVNAENPWPGLEAFAESDCEFFFGRAEETAELLRLVRRETLTVLFGQSGLGKTSLLRAGLFPQLRHADFLPIYLRLGHGESAAPLIEQVRATINAAIVAGAAEAPLWETEETPWEYFHRQEVEFWSEKNRLLTPVLVFDQFEELFTLGRENAARRLRGDEFVTALADLIEQRPPAALKERWERGAEAASRFWFEREGFKVLLSLREDYLPDLDGLRPQIRSIMQNRFRIRRMDGRQAFEVVAGPGKEIVDREVAGQIVRLVSGSAGRKAESEEQAASLGELMVDPALLSLVCRQLNNRRLALGQPKITGDLIAESKQEILEKFYHDSLDDLAPEVAVFIEDELLTRSGFRNNVALEDALLEPGMTQAVVDQLIKRRLLRCEERLGVLRVELTHDVLTGVIRAQRDLRRQDAAKAELAVAARERDEANARLDAERARVKRERRKTVWAAATSLLAILCAIVGWIYYLRAARATRRADEVINFLSDDLRNKLYPLGQLQVLKDVNDRVLNYLEPIGLDYPETAVLQRKAAALMVNGDILARLGKSSEGLEKNLRGLEFHREVVRRLPNDPAARFSLSLQLGAVGWSKRTQADLAGAVPFFREGLAVGEKTAAGGPPYVTPLIYWRSNLAGALEVEGKADAAMVLFEANTSEAEGKENDANAADYERYAFINAHIDMGDALVKRGKLGDALQHFLLAHEIAKKMIETQPADIDHQYSLSQTSDRLGTAYQAEGKFGEALEAVKGSHTVFAELWSRDEANTVWQRNYSVTGWRVIQMGLIQGGQPLIGGALEGVLRIRRNLAALDKTNAAAADDLSETLIGMGTYLWSRGKLTEAGAHYREALEIRTWTAGKDATNLDRQELLAEAYERMGDWAAWRGEEAAALESYGRTREIRTRTVQQDPTNYYRKARLADVEEAVGETQTRGGDLAAALTVTRHALELRQELAKKDEMNAQWQAELAESHRKLGRILLAQNDAAGALDHVRQCGEVMAKLSDLAQNNIPWREQMVVAAIDRASLYTRENDSRAAAGLRGATDMQKGLLDADPENVPRQMRYAQLLWLTAEAVQRFEADATKAQQMRAEARALVQKLKGKVEFTREQQEWANAIERGAAMPN